MSKTYYLFSSNYIYSVAIHAIIECYIWTGRARFSKEGSISKCLPCSSFGIYSVHSILAFNFNLFNSYFHAIVGWPVPVVQRWSWDLNEERHCSAPEDGLVFEKYNCALEASKISILLRPLLFSFHSPFFLCPLDTKDELSSFWGLLFINR